MCSDLLSISSTFLVYKLNNLGCCLVDEHFHLSFVFHHRCSLIPEGHHIHTQGIKWICRQIAQNIKIKGDTSRRLQLPYDYWDCLHVKELGEDF